MTRFWKTSGKGENLRMQLLYQFQIRPDWWFSFNNQANTIVPLFSTSVMFSRIETDPQVAPDKWSRFDLLVVIGCTASVSIQLSAFTKWLSTDTANWQIITSIVVQLRKALKQMSLVLSYSKNVFTLSWQQKSIFSSSHYTTMVFSMSK